MYDFDPLHLFESYDEESILENLEFCRRHVVERVPRLDLKAPECHGDRSLNTLELQIYSIRHLMQRTGELVERLGTRTGAEIDWWGRSMG